MSARSNPERERRLLMLSIALFAVAGCIFGALFLLQSQPVRKYLSLRALRASSGAGGMVVAHLSPAEEKAIIAHTLWLRDRWEPWARSHKEELRRMLTATPEERAAFAQVYNALPLPPTYNGTDFTAADLSTGAASYTWDPAVGRIRPPARLLSDTTVRARVERADRICRAIQEHNWTVYRDIALARSVNIGIVDYTLWASGRVTETTRKFPFPRGGDPLLSASEREIASKFDFLR